MAPATRLIDRLRSWLRSLPREVVVLWVLAALFYAIGAWWWVCRTRRAPDRVHAWGVDDDTPLGPLTQLHEIINPQPNPWLSYPLMHMFVAAAAYAPYFLGLVATGQFTGISATYPFGLTDPVAALRTLSIIAHLLSVFMGAVVVGAAAWIGRALWGRDTGVLYGVLVLLSFPLVYYARVGNVDATASAFSMLAVAVFVDAMRRGSGSRAPSGSAPSPAPLWPRRSRRWESLPPCRSCCCCGASIRPTGLGGVARRRILAGCGGGWGRLRGFVRARQRPLRRARRFFAHIAYLRGLLELVSRADVGHPFAFPSTLAGDLGYCGPPRRN